MDEKQNDGVLRGHVETHFQLERIEQARLAVEEEKSMKFATVLRKYWKAVLWSMTLSTALIMEGYDVGIINAFWGNAAFLERFGQTDSAGQRFIPPNWQAAINNAGTIGEIIGLGVMGTMQSRIGSRLTYLCGMVLMALAIFIPVFSNSLAVLFAGELICGVPWGMFQTLTTAYAAEISPIALRAYLASYVNMCWGIGLTLGAGVVRGTIEVNGQWSWRLPYALQWIWPVPLFIAVYFAPDSPWWLVKRGRIQDAKTALRRLAADGSWTEESLDSYVALIEYTNELEKEEVAGTSFIDCFKRSNRRRTEIACVVWTIQYSCGQPIVNYTTQFLQTAGLSEANAFDINLVQNCMIVLGTILGWLAMYYTGRRSIYITGCAMMALDLGLIGVLGCIKQTSGVTWGIGGLLIVLTLIFSVTVGPSCYSIVAELPAARVRQQTVVIARGCYLVAGIIVQQLNPRMLGVADWNWGAKAGFFYLGTNFVSVIYCYFRLPESKGRTYGELDVLFSNNVPARKFKSTAVSEFEDTTVVRASAIEEKAYDQQVER